MKNYLVTGGSGFLGSLLIQRLLSESAEVVSVDLEPPIVSDPRLRSIQGDIRDRSLMTSLCKGNTLNAVFHCAAKLAHGVESDRDLWTSNVDGTRIVAEAARAGNVPSLIYVSSNCLWGSSLGRPVREDDEPAPIELYGRSKWEGERILQYFAGDLNVITLRCPTIIEEGRLGLLAILFSFIEENRRVWVVGGGENRYQFIYAGDLIAAMLRASTHPKSATFGVGADDVRPLREIYQYVIEKANSRSRVSTLPLGPSLLAMRTAYALGMSPLGPYHYKMIAESFSFDTTAIKRDLSWAPSLSNHEMLFRAYRYYASNREEIARRTNVSAHRKAADMGIIRLLKWIS